MEQSIKGQLEGITFGEAQRHRNMAVWPIFSAVDGGPRYLTMKEAMAGGFLSGGQRQRIALARAVYGHPSLIVLDEPNASLDDAGEAALVKTVEAMKKAGCTVVLITHRTPIISAVEKILILRDGQIAAFGPRDEVLKARAQAARPAVQAVSAPSA